VATIEDVLSVYAGPTDEAYPVVGIDEKSYQLLDPAREPLLVKPGHTEKIDNAYRGICSIFMVTNPLGDRHVEALPRKTKQDGVHQIT
jgi:hypothetical protein